MTDLSDGHHGGSRQPPDRAVVRAAGGVVWRRSGDTVEVVIVHRPAPRGDWSFPKGKLEAGERHSDAALREVHEETGLRCDLGTKLAEVRYDLPTGEDKRVRWWSMTVTGDDGFEPNREIDERRWVSVAQAPALLTWDVDRLLLAELQRRVPETAAHA